MSLRITVHDNFDTNKRQSRRERAAISCDRERKSASSACYIHFINARKSVENYGVFSLSFGTFLSLFFATKEKEKYIKENFIILKLFLLFSFLLRNKKKKVNKKEK